MSKSTTRTAGSRRRYKVGSTYFFECYPDFKGRDTDEVMFEVEPRLFKNVLQFRKNDRTQCIFIWRKMSADEFVEYTLGTRHAMEIGKFLVPEVAEEIGFTLAHLRRLSPVVARLDKRHEYEKIIYDSYLENGGFYLTNEQRDRAYCAYKIARQL